MKSTISGTTTYFVGNYYERTILEGQPEGTVTKYNHAGAQRIAMRTGSNDPQYILSDHLGSTTVTTDASGNLISELRYKAWGEVRSGSAPTHYTYTGQYSNTVDFGLMYYNSRWYDPDLGRMAQADSIVPGGVQGYDRYAYVRNSPLRYADPSGHRSCEYSADKGRCLEGRKGLVSDLESTYRIRIKGPWDEGELRSLRDALSKAAAWAGGQDNLSNILERSASISAGGDGSMTFDNRGGMGAPKECEPRGWACFVGTEDSIILSDYIFTNAYQKDHLGTYFGQLSTPGILDLAIQKTMIHEIGHAFAQAHPTAVNLYTIVVADQQEYYPTQGVEENMVTAIAIYAVDPSVGVLDQNLFAAGIVSWLGYP